MADSGKFAGTMAARPLAKVRSSLSGDRIAYLVTLLFAVSIIILTVLVLYKLV